MAASIVRFWAGMLLVLATGSGSLADGALPRYALKPGHVLTYEENLSFKGQRISADYKFVRQFWVVGRNGDGGLRVVTREVRRNSRVPNEMVTIVRFDLQSDGNIPVCPTLGTRVEHFFPRLPGDDRQAAAGWEARDHRDDATIRYETLHTNANENGPTFDFQADQNTFAERIYEGTDRRTFHFDRKKGLVVRAEVEWTSGQLRGKGSGTLELKSVEEVAPAKLVTLRDEMDRYFDAQAAYDQLSREAVTSGGGAEALLKKARTVLDDARARVTLPEPLAAFDEAIKDHDRSSQNQVDAAKRFAEFIGRPAPSWEIKDLDGRAHALEQYRGKVLVLDFWYRGCGWCMQAMPQVKHVAAHYRGQPVAVLGMNNDRDEADARFVAREMRLDYPVLRSEELPGQYGVHGFPTLIIIDGDGKVADIHVGYSPHLFEEVTATVDRLLVAK